MRKLIWIFSICLIIFSLGIIVIYGASGHKFDLNKLDNQIYLFLILLYSSSAITLILKLYKKTLLITRILITLLFLVLVSFLYFFYEIFSIKIGDLSAIVPIFLGLSIVFMNIKILIYFIKNDIEDLQ